MLSLRGDEALLLQRHENLLADVLSWRKSPADAAGSPDAIPACRRPRAGVREAARYPDARARLEQCGGVAVFLAGRCHPGGTNPGPRSPCCDFAES